MAHYVAMHPDGVRFAHHRFAKGERIPDSVRNSFPGPFQRALDRGHVAVAVETGTEPPDLSKASKKELEEAVERLGATVTPTGAGGKVLKADLIRALSGGG